MRSDAANLLSRLGQNSFKYQEFRDNFADMELWPLFEALIRDPRISGEGAVPDATTHAEPARSEAAPMPGPVRSDGLFGRYDDTRAAPRAHEDVRSLLRQLNDRVASGEL